MVFPNEVSILEATRKSRVKNRNEDVKNGTSEMATPIYIGEGRGLRAIVAGNTGGMGVTTRAAVYELLSENQRASLWYSLTKRI